jgi:hypothetical protein
MRMLARLIKRRVAKIEAMYWEGIREHLVPDEVQIDYLTIDTTPSGIAPIGHCFLTSHKIIATVNVGGRAEAVVLNKVPITDMTAFGVFPSEKAIAIRIGDKGVTFEAAPHVPSEMVVKFFHALLAAYEEVTGQVPMPLPELDEE